MKTILLAFALSGCYVNAAPEPPDMAQAPYHAPSIDRSGAHTQEACDNPTKCACGLAGQACCLDRDCWGDPLPGQPLPDAGFRLTNCIAHVCVHCGGIGEPCCAWDVCNWPERVVCSAGVCAVRD